MPYYCTNPACNSIRHASNDRSLRLICQSCRKPMDFIEDTPAAPAGAAAQAGAAATSLTAPNLQRLKGYIFKNTKQLSNAQVNELYRRGFVNNDGSAQYELGDHYLFEYYDNKSKARLSLGNFLGPIALESLQDQARENYKKAADAGYAPAQCTLAYCYLTGDLKLKGFAEDAKEAVTLLERAVSKGYLEAKVLLAYCYREGVGAAKNEQKAVTLYQDAAAEDHLIALNNLAACYAHGSCGLPKNDYMAFIFCRKAAAVIKRQAEQEQHTPNCQPVGVQHILEYDRYNRLSQKYRKRYLKGCFK